MAYDPCLTVADPSGPVHVVHHHARAAHRIVGRIRHRVHHTQNVASAHVADVPSDACGKHLPGKPLAKFPVAAAPKAAVVGAASLLGAAGVAGAVGGHGFVSPPGGPGLPPPVITVPPVTVVTPPPPVSVPEPSSIVLFLVAVAAAMMVRHAGRRRLARAI